MPEHKTFIGGLWEDDTWELRENEEVAMYDSDTPFPLSCPHASKPIHDDGHRWTVRVPRVVVMFNEGGHATTGVCADCILDALVKHDA